MKELRAIMASGLRGLERGWYGGRVAGPREAVPEGRDREDVAIE